MNVNNALIGEPIERKIERMINNNEPTSGDGSVPLIYTERKDGVLAGYDIRTDRWEVALDAATKVHKGSVAKRDAKDAAQKAADVVDKVESVDGGNDTE